jgi:hypothetical protein
MSTEIKFTYQYGYGMPKREEQEGVESYVANCLECRDEGNDLTRASREASNARYALGRLVEVLTEKGILNLEDILRITESKQYEHEEGYQLLVNPTS